MQYEFRVLCSNMGVACDVTRTIMQKDFQNIKLLQDDYDHSAIFTCKNIDEATKRADNLLKQASGSIRALSITPVI